ncbi:hypothetical protein V8E53_003076 [Lactarius tabidus]
MSRTPDFGGDQDDGATPSITPATPPTNPLIHSMDKAIADATGPVWATICHLEAAILGGPVQPDMIAPVLTNQGTKSWTDNQGATPFPLNNEPPQSKNTNNLPRVDNDDAFPPLEMASGLNNHRWHNNLVKERQRQSVPGATGPTNNDRFITMSSNQSRIRPLFANVATEEAIAQQQCARTVQGHRITGNQGSIHKTQSDAELTEVAVIQFGGLEDAEAKQKFRACNPIEIVQAVQLAKQTKNPPAVLSGRWSVSSNSTGNFVYTLTGIIPPCNLMSLKQHLCSPFKGHMELVPTKGWTWLQLQQVPTEDLDWCVWGPDDLLKAFTANPCFKDTLICVQPHWQGNLLNNNKMFSTILAAIIDKDNSICQAALTHGGQPHTAAMQTMPYARSLL